MSTLAFALLFLLLRGPLGAAGANAAALAITAVGNTAANRRLTFGLRGREDVLRHHVRGAAVFVLTLALTNGALARAARDRRHAAARRSSSPCSCSARRSRTVTRYVALKTWVFAQRRRAARRAPGAGSRQ